MDYYSKKVFESGEYEGVQVKIGVELKAGTYAIFSYLNEYNSNICLSTDANQDNVIIYESFDYNLFLTVKDKQYLEINNAYLVEYEAVTKLDPKESNMLIIGKHIPEGEYKVTVFPDEDSWSDTIKVQCLNCRKTKEYGNEKVRSKFQGRGIKALGRHWNQEDLRTA